VHTTSDDKEDLLARAARLIAEGKSLVAESQALRDHLAAENARQLRRPLAPDGDPSAPESPSAPDA
jgi:hypothetical protein